MDRELEAAVSATVEKYGPLTAPEVAARLDEHPARIQRVCDRLQQGGRLRQVTGGAYVRTDLSAAEPVASD
jgi:predicted transcriptional regulator of viral defense system